MFRPDDTRETYDRVASRYAEEIAGELDHKPLDRDFLDRFARSMEGREHVVELGCGPANVAGFLRARGVNVSGLDASPQLVAQAKRLFPDLPVEVGDMLALPFADHSIDGLVAFYSIIHFDDGQLARAFAEMARVIEREGLVALAFHVGDGVVHRDEWWGHPVAIDARSLLPHRVTRLLADAGFAVVSNEERDPYAPKVEFQSRRAYIVARPLVPLPGDRPSLPPFGLGYPRTDLRRRLVEAVLRGDKVATAGMAYDFAPRTFDPVPAAGDRWALLGFDDEPVVVVETTKVRLVPAGQVDVRFARDEGEGFESVADWRAAHERFWPDREITDEAVMMCERFRVVERLG